MCPMQACGSDTADCFCYHISVGWYLCSMGLLWRCFLCGTTLAAALKVPGICTPYETSTLAQVQQRGYVPSALPDARCYGEGAPESAGVPDLSAVTAAAVQVLVEGLEHRIKVC